MDLREPLRGAVRAGHPVVVGCLIAGPGGTARSNGVRAVPGADVRMFGFSWADCPRVRWNRVCRRA